MPILFLCSMQLSLWLHLGLPVLMQLYLRFSHPSEVQCYSTHCCPQPARSLLALYQRQPNHRRRWRRRPDRWRGRPHYSLLHYNNRYDHYVKLFTSPISPAFTGPRALLILTSAQFWSHFPLHARIIWYLKPSPHMAHLIMIIPVSETATAASRHSVSLSTPVQYRRSPCKQRGR